jgi:hypothetical protein
MDNESAPDRVLLTASGMAVHVPFAQTTPEQDRLRIAWCLLGAAAMNLRVDKPIEVPDRYFVKVLSRLPDDMNLLYPRLHAWANQTRKKAVTFDVFAAVALLLGNQTRLGALKIEYPTGVVDRDIMRTAQLLLGHPEEHEPSECDACRAIRTRQWSLAMRCAAGTDTPIILAALIELYRGGLAAGLVPFVGTPATASAPAVGTVTTGEEEAEQAEFIPGRGRVIHRFPNGQVICEGEDF